MRRIDFVLGLLAGLGAGPIQATPFTMTVPATGVPLPTVYPQAGGVAIVLTGANGNIYYQFSDPTGAFVGYQNTGSPAAFRGNPFTINNPITLNCGARDCPTYFGGAIARIDIRFSAFDGDTGPGEFDVNDITLRLNGYDVGNWSGRTTEATNNAGTVSLGFGTGFQNDRFSTGWFSSTNAALLADILTTGRTVTQVFDRDPNDNYWDFTRGESLSNPELRNIAPGYAMDKELVGGGTSFASVGQVLTYRYTVRNIGSVNINNVTVVDDRIPNVTCPSPANLPRTSLGGTPSQIVCTGTYTITQADVDAGSLTNIARANGTPEFGSLGEVTDSVTLTGPAQVPAITLDKTAQEASFGNAGTTVTYLFTLTNAGNTTLSNVVVSDPRLPGLSCSFASIPPASSANPAPGNQRTCTATYTVTQSDVDAWLISGTRLTNQANVTARAPSGAIVSVRDDATLPGPAAAPALTLDKVGQQASYAAAGDVVTWSVAATNTGNVTWPEPPTIADPLGPVTCPAGAVAPGATVTCSVRYTVTQADVDRGSLTNTATARVTVSGATAQVTASETIPAAPTASVTVAKSLAAGSPNPFAAVGDRLVYTYSVTNTGTVSLSGIAVTDDRATVTCPAGSVAPGASLVCSATYTVTQADLDAGSVTNRASATATSPTLPAVRSSEVSLTVPARQAPSMTIDKTAENVPPLAFVPGAVVDYSYAVSNDGNVTLVGPIDVIDNRITAPIRCAPGPLAPGARVTCTASYTVTVADVARGLVENRAYATDGATRSREDTAIIPQQGAPGLTLGKVADTTDFDAVGDTLDFTITVTNTGSVALTSAANAITLSDPGTTLGACTQPAILYPVGNTGGATPTSYTCLATRSVTQADLDAGLYTNRATASFPYTPPSGTPTTITAPEAEATVTSSLRPAFTFTKTSADVYDSVGDVITYTFTVTNDTAQTLTRVTVTDPLIPDLGCTLTNVPPNTAPDPSRTCTGTYAVTQADLDAGRRVNSATAVGTSPDGATATRTATAEVTIDPAAATRAMATVKTASPANFAASGDVITYTIAVENTGNLTLRDIEVEDAAIGLTCAIPAIAPGATDRTCSGSRPVTQADLDTGLATNTATVSVAGVAPQTPAVTVTGPAAAPALAFAKAADGPFGAVGDTVVFRFRVQNTGNVTVTDVRVTDALFDPDLDCAIGTLAPGALDATTCVGTHVVTQADVDRGSLTNTATVSGSPVRGTLSARTATATAAGPAAAPGIEIDKVEADGTSAFGSVGTVEEFRFTVRNTGNVTLSDVVVSDPLTGFSCTVDTLAPGEEATTCADGAPLTTSYTIRQGDVNAGSLSNVAEVTATGPGPSGARVLDTDRVDLAGPDQLPALTVDKSATAGVPFDSIGDTVSYRYVVTNTGNITLTSLPTVSDDRTGVACPPLPTRGLAPGATLACTANYRVTQADLDAGQVTNTATARVSQPVRPSPTWPSGRADVTSAPDSVTAAAAQAPDLTLTKRLASNSPGSFDAPGDVITFEFVVTNTGNVTVLAPVTVADARISANVTCSTAPLAPGASVTCTVPWTATQAAVDAGGFSNSATAAGRITTPTGPATVTSDPATLRVPAVRRPAMSATKSFVGITNDTFGVGEEATYRFDLINTGNTTLDGPITVEDDRIGDVECLAAGALLAPGDAVSCEALYTIRAEDVEVASVTNIASAVAADGTRSPPVSETIPESASPALTLVKTADVASFAAAGDEIVYTYEIRNTSGGPIRPQFILGLTVVDDRFAAPLTCLAPSVALGVYDPSNAGPVALCTQTYTVTQADMDSAISASDDRPFVTNNAVAVGPYGTITVQSPPDTVTVYGAAEPSLDVAKTAANLTEPGAPFAAGQVARYTITAENAGNQTLTVAARPVDPLLPSVSCAPALPATLAPGAVLTCTGDYTVTQADLDAQVRDNSASVTATSPNGETVTASDSTLLTLATPSPVLELTKTQVDRTGYQAPGETLNFAVAVRNAGNVTLTDIAVTDELVPNVTCTIPTLAPGDTDSRCTFDYVVRQADIDAGEIANTVIGSAQPAVPGASRVTGTDTLDVPGPARRPEVLLAKTGTPAQVSAVGQIVTYAYTILNGGNVSLTGPVAITDDRIGPLTCDALDPPAQLAPSEAVICTATDVVTQADLDAGGLTNVATLSLPDPLGGAPLEATATETVEADRQPALAAIKRLVDAPAAPVPGQTVTFEVDVTNSGNVTLAAPVLTEEMVRADGTPVAAQPAPAYVSGDDGDNALQPGETWLYRVTYALTQADIDAGGLDNSVVATADAPGGGVARDRSGLGATDDAPTFYGIDRALALVADKSVTPDRARIGETVTYTMTFRNDGPLRFLDLRLVDRLPAGIVLTPGTVRLDGVAVTPEGSPSEVEVPGVAIAPGATVTLTLDARLIDGSGDLTNRAWAATRDGDPVSATATATLREEIEPVFQCTDVIGRVFDDLDRDGYLDLRWQDEAASDPENAVEPGLPLVRLVTPTGTWITTDEFGRFSVPCADLPATEGSNFTLKLDETSLPSGYRVTSENPRTIRLSPGLLSWMEFGAAEGRVIAIDLTADAFAGTAPSPALVEGLAQVATAVSDEPVTLRLAYFTRGENPATARARLDAVEDLIDRTWPRAARDGLVIDRSISAMQ